MNVLSIQNVTKQYSNHRAVDNISFDVPAGSIFGLLGPNGAGKTSLIRIITRITGADSGAIILNGVPINAAEVREVGYMPEERGLYKKMRVGEHLMYLAQLKGLSHKESRTVINEWFDKFDIGSWWNKKIEELSKGMQQKIQFIATVMHKPSLIILDEPFTGLDPINTNLIKDEIHRMNEEGVSIIFSTHRMEQVEEICKDIVLIDNGSKVLEGKVSDIKQKFKEHLFEIDYIGEETLRKGSSFDVVGASNGNAIVQISDHASTNHVIHEIIEQGVQIQRFEERLPSLNDIFIKIVESKKR